MSRLNQPWAKIKQIYYTSIRQRERNCFRQLSLLMTEILEHCHHRSACLLTTSTRCQSQVSPIYVVFQIVMVAIYNWQKPCQTSVFANWTAKLLTILQIAMKNRQNNKMQWDYKPGYVAGRACRLSFICPVHCCTDIAVYPPTMDEQPLDAGILDLATHR